MSPQSSKSFSLIAILFLTISAAFSQTNQDVFSPVFSHLSGRYNTDLNIDLSSQTPGTTIYYTLDETTPNSSSQVYTGPIPVTGDEAHVTLKAIAIGSGALQSFVSSATYVIDYSYDPNASYLTNLSWSQYNNYIDGDWFGYVSTPWTCDYSVKVKILGTGNYIDTSTTTSCFSSPQEDVFLPVFYYGIADTSSMKTIEFYDILPSGYANGFITIVFQSTTNQYELRYIKFQDEDNLFIEFWHGTNGPLYYRLTKHRKELGIDDEHVQATPLVYPNPTSNYLVIEDLQSDVTITNQLGQIVVLEKQDKIDVSHLPKGLYFVQFTTTSGQQLGQKIEIN